MNESVAHLLRSQILPAPFQPSSIKKKKKVLFFRVVFSFLAKEQKVWRIPLDSLLPSFLHTAFPPSTSPPEWTFVIISEATLMHHQHPEFPFWLNLVHSVGFGQCIMTCICHCSIISLPWNSSVLGLCSLNCLLMYLKPLLWLQKQQDTKLSL